MGLAGWHLPELAPQSSIPDQYPPRAKESGPGPEATQVMYPKATRKGRNEEPQG